MEQERKEYIESELAKWKEVYLIGFKDEFDLKAMFDLEYQFLVTPKDHVKTLGDIVHTKNLIKKNLNLKSKFLHSNKEIFIADIDYLDIERNKYDMTVLSLNYENGKVKRLRNLKNPELSTSFSNMAALLMADVLKYKPSKVVFDDMGMGMGLKDAFYGKAKENSKLDIKDNGDVVYYNK